MARNPFTTLPPTDTTYVQAGFTLGGPIKRNKLFFFGDYVRTNDDSGRITRAHVPEAAFRTGDFSSAPTTIYDPATGTSAGVGRAAFEGNQIPADRTQSHRAGPALEDADCRTSPVHRLAQLTTSNHTSAKGARTSTTSRLPIRWRPTISYRCATAIRTRERPIRGRSASGAASRTTRAQGTIRRTTWPSTTTACGRRAWCRKSGWGAPRITTSPSPMRTG